MSYLISLGGRQRAERARRLAEIRNHLDPGRRLSPEQFRKRLDRTVLHSVDRLRKRHFSTARLKAR